MIHSISFYSRYEAEKMKPSKTKNKIISIHDSSEAPASLNPDWKDKLVLCFHDADPNRGLGMTLFNQDHAERVLNFVEKVMEDSKDQQEKEEIVVHCQMGVSRSAAIAMMISEVMGIKCKMKEKPVTFETYKNYNKHVYRVLINEYERRMIEKEESKISFKI